MPAYVVSCGWYLHVCHPVHNVAHLLEQSLEVTMGIQTLSACSQKLFQILPETQHVISSCEYTPHIMVAFHLQLLGNSLHCSHSLPVRPNVRLNGLMFSGGSLHCSQVSSKVVLITGKLAQRICLNHSSQKNDYIYELCIQFLLLPERPASGSHSAMSLS